MFGYCAFNDCVLCVSYVIVHCLHYLPWIVRLWHIHCDPRAINNMNQVHDVIQFNEIQYRVICSMTGILSMMNVHYMLCFMYCSLCFWQCAVRHVVQNMPYLV
ncbi:hypothetical protein KP509_10G030500 [Ceratopteris richardii]|uniref:Uncharacterized protein n=1 Tax=Ceratopteris richardii TaxID=49495 RepID=A0A8T2TTY6_CERRI|nr:hypothetical protein KP509_10G030500 [Ceratopteris richardii]